MAHDESRARALLPFFAALVGVACFAFMDASIKWLVTARGLVLVSTWRSLLSLCLSASLYLPSKNSWPDRSTLRVHLTRGLVVASSAAFFFWGIAHVRLAQGIALTFVAPIFAQLLSKPLLGERASRESAFGASLGFVGALIIALPGNRLGDISLGTAAVLVSALLYGLNLVLARRQALAAGPREISFFQSLVGASCWWGFSLVRGFPGSPGRDWLWLIIASTLSTTAALFLAWAYRRAEASYLSVTEFSGFLWATILGWVVFHERLSGATLGGAMLIIGGCSLALAGQRQKKALVVHIQEAPTSRRTRLPAAKETPSPSTGMTGTLNKRSGECGDLQSG